MKTLIRFSALSLIVLLSTCAPISTLDLEALRAAEINNFRAPQSEVLSTGQPSADQLRVMANSGVRHLSLIHI